MVAGASKPAGTHAGRRASCRSYRVGCSSTALPHAADWRGSELSPT
jgi:hypothetical protein